MKLKKLVLLFIATTPFVHSAYAYNEDLFNENSNQVIIDNTNSHPNTENNVVILSNESENKTASPPPSVPRTVSTPVVKNNTPKDVYNENLFDDIEIKGKPSQAQLSALESLAVDSKKNEVKPKSVPVKNPEVPAFQVQKQPIVVDTNKKDESKNKNNNKNDSFKVVKEKIDIPPDHSKNKIELIEIEDRNVPSVLGEVGKIDEWQKFDPSKSTTVKSKPQPKTQNVPDPTSDNSVDEFYGINKDAIKNSNSTAANKKATVDSAVPLPGSLPSTTNKSDNKNIVSTTVQTVKSNDKSVKPIEEKKPVNGFLNNKDTNKKEDKITSNNSSLNKVVPKKEDVKVDIFKQNVVPATKSNNEVKTINAPLPTGDFFGGTKKTTTINTPNKTSSIRNNDELKITTTDSLNKSALNIPVIPIPETLAKPQVVPKAIRGNKIAASMLGKEVYIRIFKQEHSLELWLKQGEQFQLANTYDICTYSGGLGPKKTVGDHKSPEGFYSVNKNHLQPNSSYYKAINIGFPNAYDRSHGYTGKYLMIHGDCVSIGCYAMTNNYIKEIYKYVEAAFNNGQSDIKINIYPFKMTDKNLNRYKGNSNYAFWKQLQPGYKYFEVTRQPPNVEVSQGKYVINLPSGFKDPDSEPMFAKN